MEMLAAGNRVFLEKRAELVKAQKRAEDFQKLGEAAKSNSLIQRAPEVVEEYLQQAAEDSGVASVYIDAEALHQSGLAEQLATLSPAVASQYEEALQTGSTIEIPAGEYLTKNSISELNDALVPHLQFAKEPSLHQVSNGVGAPAPAIQSQGTT